MEPEPYDGDERQILGHQDCSENLQKIISATFSDAAKKTSKNLEKNVRPGNFEKLSKNPPTAPLKPSKNHPRKHV